MNEQWSASGRESPDIEVLSESALAMAQATIQRAMVQSKISKATLARKMDTPRSFISRMLSGSHNLTVKTMARALAACGYEIEFGLTPVVWNWTSAETRPLVEVQCNNTVPSPEGGTLVPASFDSLAAECSLGNLGFSN
jgi:transcriptional regulator with XRE-family HTH domain